jgi:Alpha/beta hydrolase domain
VFGGEGVCSLTTLSPPIDLSARVGSADSKNSFGLSPICTASIRRRHISHRGEPVATFARPDTVSITIDDERRVSGLLQAPETAQICYVLAHGAGAGMSHPFMAAVADGLAERGIAFLFGHVPSDHLLFGLQHRGPLSNTSLSGVYLVLLWRSAKLQAAREHRPLQKRRRSSSPGNKWPLTKERVSGYTRRPSQR